MNFAKFLKTKYIGAGIVFFTPEKEILFLKKLNNKWTFPGGHKEENEISPLVTAQRECQEELGHYPHGKIIGKIKYIRNGETLPVYSFFMKIETKFIPTISNEHKDYSWVYFKNVKPNKLTSGFKPYWKMYETYLNNAL